MASSIVGLLDGLNLEQLNDLLSVLQEAIRCKSIPGSVSHPGSVADRDAARVLDVEDFVKYRSERFIDMNIEQLLSAEIESLQFKRNSSNDAVQNRFISAINGTYEWDSSHGPVKNQALDLVDFPVMKTIMDTINVKHDCALNSVLVSYYKSGSSGVGLHHDDEDTLHQNEPICVLSLGAPRRVEFVNNGHEAYNTAMALTPEHGSLYVMLPGTQSYFRHRVRKDRRIRQPRISLSFRAFTPIPQPGVSTPPSVASCGQEQVAAESGCMDTPVRPHSSTPYRTKGCSTGDCKPSVGYSPFPGHKDDTLHPPTITTSDPNPNERLCLIFGSSITESVDGKRISRGNRTVVNLSSSGFRIGDVQQAAIDFARDSPGIYRKVDKIIINIGTNEIKGFNCFNRNVAKAFWSPLSNLVQCLQHHFSRAQIIFQSVLPIRLFYSYNAETVNQFNKLLIRVCHAYGCIFFDCFHLFLDSKLCDINWDLYQFSRRGNRFNQGIHLNGPGLGVLCRALKFAVYHNMYNPHPHFSPFKRFYVP